MKQRLMYSVSLVPLAGSRLLLGPLTLKCIVVQSSQLNENFGNGDEGIVKCS